MKIYPGMVTFLSEAQSVELSNTIQRRNEYEIVETVFNADGTPTMAWVRICDDQETT